MLNSLQNLRLSLVDFLVFLVLSLSLTSPTCLGSAEQIFFSITDAPPKQFSHFEKIAAKNNVASAQKEDLPESSTQTRDKVELPWISGDLAGELGYELNYSLYTHKRTSSRPFLWLSLSGAINNGKADYKISILGRKETIKKNFESHNALRPDEVWLAKTLESSRMIVGLQKITWGETFGIPIVDIVNPQDTDEHPLNRFEDNKLPAWMINYQMVENAWNFQLIASPWHEQKIVPPEYSLISIDRASNLNYRKIFEWGGRVGYLFENGLDIKAFFYHHENRYPIFEPTLNSEFLPVLQQVQTVEDSYGVSQSFAFDTSVLRWDWIYTPEFHLNSPTTGKLFRVPRFGSALGYDYSTDFDLLWGLQLQSEILFSSQPDLEEVAQLHYFATQFIYPANSTSFQIKSLTFCGLESDEVWQRLELMLYFFSNLQADLVWDDIQGQKIGLLSRNRNADRLYVKLKWLF